MKLFFSLSLKVLFISIFIQSCNNQSNDSKGTDNTQDTSISVNNETSQSLKGSSSESNLTKDSVTDLLNELKKIPASKGYMTVGDLKTDILKFKSVAFGDIMHYNFIDPKNKEYDFSGNITKVELEQGASNPEDEDGYEANKKYINKNFRVVWRTVKLNHPPKDEMEMYYEEYNEIIYLKQID
jgi:hypothetical protein